MNLKNKNVLVVGLAKSGQSAIELLKEQRANVFVFDDNQKLVDRINEMFSVKQITINEEDLRKIDLVVLSPGVSVYHEIIKQCYLLGIKVVSELDLGSWFVKGKILALTGSNGKTTTASLLKHIFDTANKKSELAGNVGVPLSRVSSVVKKWYIVEVSSFQLETANIKPFIAGITNLSENHLNRHFSYNEYIQTKYNIFKNQTKRDYLVLNADDEILRNLTNKQVNSKIVWFSRKKQVDGAFIKDDYFCYKKGKKIIKICETSCLKLIGEHNKQNCLCAICYAMISKIKPSVIKKAIISFKPIEHRVELVKNIKGIEFVNDSKSTTPCSTEKCVSGIDKPIILILGGSDKGLDYDDFVKKVADKIKLAVLTGDISEKLKKSFDDNLKNNYLVEKDFFKAMVIAYENAEKGDCVVLSPATASFDQFKNYEERGKAFKSFVNGIDE